MSIIAISLCTRESSGANGTGIPVIIAACASIVFVSILLVAVESEVALSTAIETATEMAILLPSPTDVAQPNSAAVAAAAKAAVKRVGQSFGYLHEMLWLCLHHCFVFAVVVVVFAVV